jgi:hypothetical protein
MWIPGLVFLFATIVHLGRGGYNPTAPLLTLSFLIWVFRVLRDPRAGEGWSLRDRFLEALPVYFCFLAAFKPNLASLAPDRQALFDLMRWGTFVAVAVLAWTRVRARFALHALLFLGAGLVVPLLSPSPFIDVFQSNTLGVDHLLAGRNPYVQVYPDIYRGAYDYLPGFLYWPGTLLLEALSKALTGDIRILQILLWWGVPILMFRCRPGAESERIGAVWWSLPFLAFGFEQAWIDPMLSFSLGVMLLARKEGIAGGVAGLAATIKQYGGMFGAFALVHRLCAGRIRSGVRFALAAALTFAALVVPFLIWNPQAFLEMTVSRHVSAAVRSDALNFTAFAIRNFGSAPPAAVQASAIGLGLILSLWHQWKNGARRGIRSIPESCAILFGFSMFFGKFAFCNYHWLLISFWLLSEWWGPSAQSEDAA